MKKNRSWILFGWLALAALIVSACSAASAPNQGTQMTGEPGMPAAGTPAAGTPAAGTPAVPVTGSTFDELFINMMVPHHQGAVAMAEIALERAEHPEIKEMANAILASQQEEITQMKDWKLEWYGSSDTPAMSEMPTLEEMPGMGGVGHAMNMQAEVDSLRNASEPFDLAFIDAMIPHHQAAVDAAQMALEQAEHPEIQTLAQEIIDAQQREIEQLNAWRATWYPNSGSGGSMPGH